VEWIEMEGFEAWVGRVRETTEVAGSRSSTYLRSWMSRSLLVETMSALILAIFIIAPICIATVNIRPHLSHLHPRTDLHRNAHSSKTLVRDVCRPP
jgi:hypothetical protein